MSFHNFLIKEKDKKAMEHFYEKGFQDGEKIGNFCYCKN